MCLCTGLLYDAKDQPVYKPSTFAKKVVKPVIKVRKKNKTKK
jgi:uncharacterized protein (UPF0335 family)